MSDKQQLQEEQVKLFQFETIANKDLQQDQTELAYRDLNSTYFNLESEALKGAELSSWKDRHKTRKKAIERAWHERAGAEYNELSRRGATKSQKEQAFYAPFSLKELETFIKKSDRGGNSDLYNRVATELELYNRIKEKGNPLEAYGILVKLKKAADQYVREKDSPASSKGKIRMAIISEISSKAAIQIDTQKNEYKTRADSLFQEAQKIDATDEKTNEAFRAHYDLIYQVLNDNIELSPDELNKLDVQMETILNKVITQKVDDSQNNNISTKFFNALGWSSNEAHLVNEEDLESDGSEMEKSPLKKKMYHAINPFGNNKDAREMGKQLAGVKKKDNRLFYGLGRFGKGVYTSARDDSPEATDRDAEANSWTYGDEVGAVMLVMTLNEHARMVPYPKMLKMTKKLNDKFKKVNSILRQEHTSKGGYADYLTMQASFFGYNTLIDPQTGIKNVDYYVTTDRKALSISKKLRIRADAKVFEMWDEEELRKEG